MNYRSSTYRLRSLVAFLVIMTVSVAAQDASVMSADGIEGFATYLETIGEPRRAANELERLLITRRDTSNRLVLRISRLYLQAESFQQAAQTLRHAIVSGPSPTDPFLRYRLAEALYRQNDMPSALDELQTAVTYASPQDTSSLLRSALLFRALCFAEQRQWDSAQSSLDQSFPLSKSEEQKTSTAALRTILDASANLPQKSPLLAGILSTIVPGLGKVYTGHTVDGVLSFVSIATLTYAAVDGFISEGSGSVRGYIYGCLAGGLYLGNIYGSALSASIVREESTRLLHTRLRAAFRLAGIP